MVAVQAVRVSPTELPHQLRGMYMGSRFPDVLFGAIAFPVHEIVQVVTCPLGIKDGVDFILLVNLDFN